MLAAITMSTRAGINADIVRPLALQSLEYLLRRSEVRFTHTSADRVPIVFSCENQVQLSQLEPGQDGGARQKPGRVVYGKTIGSAGRVRQ